jgi:hypothetical protein
MLLHRSRPVGYPIVDLTRGEEGSPRRMRSDEPQAGCMTENGQTKECEDQPMFGT